MDETTIPQPTTESAGGAAPKKAYAPPQLVVHGTVADLTQKIGTNNDVDQGGSFNPGVN